MVARGQAGTRRPGAAARVWLSLVCVLVAFAAAAGARATPPPAVRARAWLVEDPTTGQVLDAHDPNGEMPIASITKLMTVLIALEHLRLDQIVTVDPRAAAVGQESISLAPGQQISVRDLVEGALIQSANDAADALALAVAPSFPAFAVLMNRKARELGLRHTHFVRPDGLDAAREYSSAGDVTRLALVAMRNPIIRETVDKQTATIEGGVALHTWNDLLGVFPGVFGVKTGNTSLAGWCQVLAARDDDTTIYVTILGSPSEAGRNAALERLLEYGLSRFRELEVVSSGLDYATVALPYGRGPLGLVASAPLVVSAPLGRPLSERVVAPLSLPLPVRAGEVVGSVEVFSGTSMLGERPLVASRAVSAPGIFGRVGWYARRSLHNAVALIT